MTNENKTTITRTYDICNKDNIKMTPQLEADIFELFDTAAAICDRSNPVNLKLYDFDTSLSVMIEVRMFDAFNAEIKISNP